MSGYSVSERKLGKDRKPVTSTCGDCGEPVVSGKLLCDECMQAFVTDTQSIMEKIRG